MLNLTAAVPFAAATFGLLAALTAGSATAHEVPIHHHPHHRCECEPGTERPFREAPPECPTPGDGESFDDSFHCILGVKGSIDTNGRTSLTTVMRIGADRFSFLLGLGVGCPASMHDHFVLHIGLPTLELGFHVAADRRGARPGIALGMVIDEGGVVFDVTPDVTVPLGDDGFVLVFASGFRVATTGEQPALVVHLLLGFDLG